jgi:predicted transcriptional regulator of viral defense system
MNKVDALKALKTLDQQGLYVFTKGDLAKLFSNESEKAFEKSLQRLVTSGILERASKGVYVNCFASSKKNTTLENIAQVLRRGHFSYLSLESMLSEYGIISQVPMRLLTVMTSGAKGVYNTPYGSIEFTHTKRSPADIIKRTLSVQNHPLRIATKATAVQDLRRVGRNVEMLDLKEMLNLEEMFNYEEFT